MSEVKINFDEFDIYQLFAMDYLMQAVHDSMMDYSTERLIFNLKLKPLQKRCCRAIDRRFRDLERCCELYYSDTDSVKVKEDIDQ